MIFLYDYIIVNEDLFSLENLFSHLTPGHLPILIGNRR